MEQADAAHTRSFDHRELARARGLSNDVADRLWARLAHDPRGQLDEDPERWRIRAYVAQVSHAEPTPVVREASAGKTTGVEAAAERWGHEPIRYEPVDDEPVATELPYRNELEQAFGTSFVSVRAYVGLDRLLGRHGAHAAAWREGVAFASRPSKALVAHELAHIVQLRNTPSARGGHSAPSDASEREADSVARAVAGGARRVVAGRANAAGVSFSPDAGPKASGGKTVSLQTVVTDAVDRAQNQSLGFGVAFRGTPGLDAAIGAVIKGTDGSRVRDAMTAAAAQIARRTSDVKVAGQAQAAQVTFDDILRLLATAFLSPGLEKYGLPRSFGNAAALDLVIREISEAFGDALGSAAAAGNDAAGAARAFSAAMAQKYDVIDAAIASVITNWDDPMDLVELELKGAIAALSALRGELAGAPAPRQREIGGKIAHLARYVLMLSHELGDVKTRIQKQKKTGDTASLSKLADAGTTMEKARSPIGSEADTLTQLGNSSDLLSSQQATSVDEAADTTTTSVAPQEAFAHHTDDLMSTTQQQIAGQSKEQETDLAAQLAKLAPKQLFTRAAFKPVYERWFGFFSKAERDDQAGQMMQIYEAAASIMPMGGWSGAMAYFGTQQAISTGIRFPGATDEFAGEIGKVPLQRSTQVDNLATRHGDSGANYRFGEVQRGTKGTGVSSERDARVVATNDAIGGRKKTTDAIYQAPDNPTRDKTAAQGGMAPAAPPGEEHTMQLYSKSDYGGGRDGAKTGWNYLLPAQIGYATLKLETVYEHKVMREEVARYLLATAQHLQTLNTKHEIRDTTRGDAPRLGDAAGAAGNVEASTADASKTYGKGNDPGAQRSQSARASLADARKTAGIDPKDPSAALGSAVRTLTTKLHASMDSFFETAPVGDRIAAIILDISVKEFSLDETIWSQFTPEALWEFAKQAIKIGALFWGLERMGPAGMLASAILKKAMFKQSQSQMVSVAMAISGWLQGAGACTTFEQARGWAFTFRSIASVVAETVRDWLAQKVGGAAAKKLGDAWESHQNKEPRTVGEMRKQLAPVFEGNPKAKSEMATQLEANLASQLKTGKPLTPEQQSMFAMLTAVDPAAAGRLAAKHKQLPKLNDSSSLGADPSLSIDTPMNLAKQANDVRTEIDAHLAKAQTIQPYRVEVLTPAEFSRRFASQKGRAAVMVHQDGRAVIYARSDAKPGAFADEAMHLIQLNDPKNPRLGENMRMLGEATVGKWDKMDLEMRKQLFDRKLEVEIDAKNRQLTELTAGTPEFKAVNDQRVNLETLKLKSDAITPDQLQLMKAAPDKAPDFLKDPAYLFAKETSTVGVNNNVPGVDLTTIATTKVTNSPANNIKGVKKVEQIGQPWTDTTVVTASNSGKVTIDPKNPNKVSIDGRAYVVEDGAKLNVKDGDIVQPGHVLATEKPEQFRLVKVTNGDGTTTQRMEFNSTKRKGWVQAGEHSQKRGAAIEKASKKQIDDELNTEKKLGTDPMLTPKPNRLTGWMRIDHQNTRGQGFDDVIVEFRGQPPKAKIRIIEVKDYPNRTVPREDMTAIRDNLTNNMKTLRADIDLAIAAKTPAQRPPAYRNLTDAQIVALGDAAKNNDIQIELRLGAQTSMGPETRKGSVLGQLRADLKNSGEFGGKDVLATDAPTTVDPKYVEAP